MPPSKIPPYDLCLILHGCPPSPETVLPTEKRWMNWTAAQLQHQGLNAIAPNMPTPWQPTYADWKREFEKYPVTSNTLLVGHSCGAAFLVHWLLETHTHVKKLILVAPAKIPETETDTRAAMYDFDLPIDASNIADEIVIFTSNDFPRHLQSLVLYQQSLRPRIVTLENKGHFLIHTMGTPEFPELLAEITQQK